MSGGGPPELESWRTTATVMLIMSAVIFLIQRFVAMFLDPVFEASIFHLPALIAVAIYLRKQGRSRLAGVSP